MVTANTSSASMETGIDRATIERAAGTIGLTPAEVSDLLVVVHAELIGRHAQYERGHDYVTVDGTRAYRVPESAFEALLSEFRFGEAERAAVEYAHTEQAKLLFAKSVHGDDNFGDRELGIVIGIDTAEQF